MTFREELEEIMFLSTKEGWFETYTVNEILQAIKKRLPEKKKEWVQDGYDKHIGYDKTQECQYNEAIDEITKELGLDE